MATRRKKVSKVKVPRYDDGPGPHYDDGPGPHKAKSGKKGKKKRKTPKPK